MASIENRSRFVVTVQNCEDLTRTFSYNREKELAAYVAQLKASGYKPRRVRTNDTYAIRVGGAGQRSQCLYYPSEEKAVDTKQRVELERRDSLFGDYGLGRSVTLADLLARYLRELSPRHKGFEVEGYIINAILADAGLARLDLADVLAGHKNPYPRPSGGRRARAFASLPWPRASCTGRLPMSSRRTLTTTSPTGAGQSRRRRWNAQLTCSPRSATWPSTPGASRSPKTRWTASAGLGTFASVTSA